MTVKGVKRLVAGLCVAVFVSSPMADTLFVEINNEGGAFMWCWAGSTQALCRYFINGFNKTVAQVASVYTKDMGTAPPINQLATLMPKIADSNGVAIKMKTVYKPGQLTWKEYKNESDEKRVFIFFIKWEGMNMYHTILATGYIGDSTRLYYMDSGNEDKRWKSWKEITGVGTIISGNEKKGTWLGSLLVVSFTSISNETKKSVAPFTIITANQAKNNGFVTLHFNSLVASSAAVRVFNLRGACVYEMTAPTGFNHAYFQVPFQFSAGNYVVSLTQNTMSDLPREAARVFSIVK
jgi:hypothetical protein